MKYIEKSEIALPMQKKSLVINNEIKTIIEKHGKVTPLLLVELATKKNNPLHDFFEWNDTEAGKKYRIMQATSMIIASKFVCMLEEKKQSGQINAIAERHNLRKLLPAYDGDGGFKDRVEVLSNEESRKSIVDRKIGVLRSWCESIVDIDELANIRSAILKIIAA